MSKVIAGSIEIDAPVERVFAIVANPHMHPEIDGSGTLKADVDGPEQLKLGDEFIVDVHQYMSYPTVNTVIEYEPNRLIAWKHVGPQAWRYRFEPLSDHRTRVIEEFDYARYGPTAIFFKWTWGGHRKAIDETLRKLKALSESHGPTSGPV
jgi:hypothetical protein